MQTVSNKSLSGIFCNANYFSAIKYQIVNKFIIFFIQDLFKFSITVFKMPLDSGRLLSIQHYWKIQLVISRLFAGDNRLSLDFFLVTTG